jgi:hypothetical protein
VSTRLVHRPARSTRSIDTGQPRVIETPPPGARGKAGGGAMQALMPAVGVLGSVGMMSTVRTGTSAVIGVGVLALTLVGTFGMAFSQRGRSGKESREQRNRYLDYLERLREDFGKLERANRKTALALNPPADALVDCVRDPARLWERRRSDPDFLLVRCATGRMPVVPATLASSGSMMDPPDPFMMAEAEALARRFALIPDMPLTNPLDLRGSAGGHPGLAADRHRAGRGRVSTRGQADSPARAGRRGHTGLADPARPRGADRGRHQRCARRSQRRRREPDPAVARRLSGRSVRGSHRVRRGAAHAVALVIPSARDDALTSINQLDQLNTDGQRMLVDKGLVIIAENQPDDPDAVRWLQSAVSDRGLGYVVIPYDDHLARAWPLRSEQLEPATRRAVLELAARLVERATR